MTPEDKDKLEQFDHLLSSSNQSWLFGAGISYDANIPLMGPLTDRVLSLAKEHRAEDYSILESIKAELVDDCHIEHILSHLGDRRAIAERSKEKTITFDGLTLTLNMLDEFHQRLLSWVAETVRWGYRPATGTSSEKIGTQDKPIVTVSNHCDFVSALLKDRQKGVSERRKATKLFTTNYDTLIEDALGLECLPYWDGFAGGAVGFRTHHYGNEEPNRGVRAHVVKLHGSIDWHLGQDGRVWRVRDGDLYPEIKSRVLIYPQATKYVATQRDPFAAQFDLLRRALASGEENVLATCGYSFGDEHINQEIELSMEHPDNKTTLLAFSLNINSTLEKWQASQWRKRLYIICEDGLFVGDDGPYVAPVSGTKRDWWTFQSVSRLLVSGPEACIS